MSPRPLRRRERGFSLLEVVVAMAILGLSLGMLYQAAGGSTRSVSISEDYVYAVNIAQSLLALHQQVGPEGVSEAGSTEDGYQWRVESEPFTTGVADVPVLYLVEVSVRWGSDVRPRQFQLQSAAPVVEPVDAL